VEVIGEVSTSLTWGPLLVGLQVRGIEAGCLALSLKSQNRRYNDYGH